MWWPAAALSVGVVALARGRERVLLTVVVLLVSAMANAAGGRPPVAAVAFGVASAAETWVVVWLFTRRTGGTVRFDAVEDGLRLLVCSVLGAGLAGVLAAVTAGPLRGVDPVTTFRSVAFSHAAALIVMTPLLLLRRPQARAPGGRLEAAAQWTGSAVLAAAAFWPGQTLPLTFLPLTTLVWGATRLGSRTAAAQLVLLAVGASRAALVGGGPMAAVAEGTAGLAVSVTQLFLVSYGIVLVPLAMAVQQRREQDVRLRASKELFRTSFDEALVGMLVLGADVPGEPPTRVVRCNPVAARMLATTVTDLVGSSWPDRVDPADVPALRRALEGVVHADPGGWRGELLHRVDGEARWMETSVVSLPGWDDAPLLSVQLADVTARRTAEQGPRDLALNDPLTRLPNRLLLTDRVEQALREGLRGGGGVALLFCDLDDFKNVNDSAGHELLVGVAAGSRTRSGSATRSPGSAATSSSCCAPASRTRASPCRRPAAPWTRCCVTPTPRCT